MRTRIWVTKLLLITLIGLAGPAPGLATTSFLLSLESEVELTFACQGSEISTMIFQDGLVVRRIKDDVGVIRLFKMQAPPEAVRRLTAALRTNRIGTVPKNCVSVYAQPNAFIDSTVTWFGRTGRSSSFYISSIRGGETCPDSVKAIRDAINAFLGAASADPGSERVDIPIERNCD